MFVGHSGVGKSTLVNALVPGALRSTGVVSSIGKGRHTSTSVFALRLPAPLHGWVIDTPGVRSFGLAHVTAQDLLWAFPDLEDGAVQCPGSCEHLSCRRRLPARCLGGGRQLQPEPAGGLPPVAGQPHRPGLRLAAKPTASGRL